jgi:hypothetical protein
MKTTVAVLFALIVLVSAQPWIDLTNGTTARTIQLASVDYQAQERVQTVYRIWIPENTASVEIDAGSVDGGCYDPDVMVGTRAPTCHFYTYDYPTSQGIVPCGNYLESYNNKTVVPASYYNGDGFYDLKFGTYWYIGVRKESYSSQTDLNCTFDLTVTINPCPVGTIGIGDGTLACVPINQINATTSYALLNVSSADTALVYVVDFSAPQSTISVAIHTDDVNLEAAGRIMSGSIFSYASCYASYNSNFGGVNLTCAAVPAGRFVIGLTTSSTNSGSGNITVTGVTCPAGKTGIDCSNTLTQFFTNITGNFIVPVQSTFYSQNVYYIDFNINDTVTLNITVTSINGTGYLVYRKDVFPYYDDLSALGQYGYARDDTPVYFTDGDSATLFITPQDTVVGGRHYFAVVNFGASTPLNYTFNVQTPSTTGASATATTAAAATTTAAAAATTAAAAAATTTAAAAATTTAAAAATTTAAAAATTTAAASTAAASTAAATAGNATTATTAAATTGAAAATTGKVTTGAAAATTGSKATTGAASMTIVPVFLMIAGVLALLF